MNKGDLVDAIAKATGLTKAAAANALDATLDSITGALKKGGKVTFTRFRYFLYI
jgi:DNA-binding protein HU-beta